MRKVLFITAALLFIWSCNKDDASESFVDQESKNEFFIIQPDNEHVKLMYDYLKNTPEQLDALQGKLLGTPHWSREVSYTSNGKPMYVIPLADFKNKEVNAILLLCAETETLKYRLFINDEDAYPTKGFDWVFEYFKQELFQINGKYKFEDTCNQKKDGVNTKATMEICNDIWAGNDTVGWIYKGKHCWSIDLPDNSFDTPGESDGGHEPFIGDISNPLGGGSSGSPSPAPPVKTSQEFLENEKLNCIWGKINNILVDQNNSLITSVFASFSGVSYNPQDIKIEVASNLVGENGKVANGTTNKEEGGYLIKINQDNLNNKAPIEIYRTIIHEMIHAHLWRKQYVSGDNFMSRYYSYIKYNKGIAETDHHKLMKDHYIPIMANALKEFDRLNGRSLDMSYYINLSWAGLHMSLPIKEKQKIQNTIDFIRERNLNCEK